MNQFQLHALPVTQPLPQTWGPVLERMLWRVQKSLTREQRRLFRFIEVGQDVAGLLVQWTWDGNEEQMAKVSLAVHEHIDRAEEEIDDLELGPRYAAEMALNTPPEANDMSDLGYTRLFLDCEWADTQAEQLVSLALVDSAGEHRFYAEIHPLPKKPTDFVRAVVYPLLDHGWASMPTYEVTRQLRAFLAKIDQPLVLFDHKQDGRLFRRALDGFGKPDDNYYGPLPVVATTLTINGDVMINIERYFNVNSPAAARRHHAMVDAEALAWAYNQALKEDAPSSKSYA